MGYWSSQRTTVEFRPAAPDTGLVFVRKDLPDLPRVRASSETRIDAVRRTALAENGATVEMVEHILAALAGLRIDNCEIIVDGAEMPADDGSSWAAAKALAAAGTIEQGFPREVFSLQETIRVGDGDLWIEARPTSDTGLHISYEMDYPSSSIGYQFFQLSINPQSFMQELAPARTFLLEGEAVAIRAQGIGKGFSYQDLLVFGPDGPIDNQVRFPNECVRHKVLDIVGDLALIGFDLNAEIVAHKTGHRLNTDLAAMLQARFRSHRSVQTLGVKAPKQS